MIPKTDGLQEYKKLHVVSYGINRVARPLLLSVLEYGRYGVSNVLDTAYRGFLGVGTTFDIFQNILFPYSLNTAYCLLLNTAYWILFPSWSLNHITHPHCEALKTVLKVGKTSMSRDGSVFVYNTNVLREQFAGLVIQQGLPFNHFENPQMTRVFQNYMQQKYNHDHLDATERIQHTSNLEKCLDFEAEILEEEVLEHEAIALSNEEVALDEAASEARSSRGEEIYDMTLSESD
uniref:Squalene synthase n=1 Tax=Tanacetum cinerariifolium TaxID=118510 RepID=A0A6L2NFM0_TANCI|nr:squalene synthase [Tanacetum cinerariifolium]